ncbi:ABC transporter permease [Nocardioides pocheonensis]|uniref:FtsX-like permease family protein n=1 Tax=Nocardioides pocheonensis TaxID=661485 RepID=A0A3N0GWX3_9ACTN|nr:FtsX-like permease family protein [Nocardioides pocheonensis]RNM16975.1 FtsX-like permease family protein [Nocardioides pocheonensis]
MLKVSLRNLFVNKLRLFLTVAAVTVGVAFVSGTFVLSDTMGKAFDQLYAGLTSGQDVIVRAKAPYEIDVTTGGTQRPLDESIVARVAGVPGVVVAQGDVAGYALVLDKAGKPIQPGGAPTIGGTASGDDRLAGDFSYRSGHKPSGPQEMALDAATAKKAGFGLGDHVDVVYQGGRRTFTLVGTIGFGKTDSILGATFAGFDLPTAQVITGKEGKVDNVAVKGEAGIGAAELRDRIAAVLPDGVEVLTAEQVASEGSASVRDAMGIFTKVLLVFAGVSLLVGSFVIWNTFNVLVAQRRREVALLRAVGASRHQVLGGVLAEAALIGLASGVIGLFAGVGLAAGIRSLMKLVGAEIPTTTPALETRTVVAALAVGLGVTMVAAIAPAWSATRVSPMEALRDAATSSSVIGRLRSTAGWVLVGAGALGLVACAWVGNVPWWTTFATLAAFAGLVTAGPLLAGGTARLADHGRRGSGWRMAARNIARNARRSAATALALTIGLTVVVAVAVTAASMRSSITAAVNDGNRSDLILQPAGMGVGMPASVAAAMRERSDLGAVVAFRESGARVNGRNAFVTGMDTAGLSDVIDLGIESGGLEGLDHGSILVSDKKAEDLGVGVGDTLTVTYPETGAVRMRVAGTFSKGFLINATYVMGMADYAPNVTSKLDAAVMLSNAPRVDPAQTKAAVKKALAAYPNVKVSDPAELTKDARHSVDQMLGLVTALLLLAVIVAILGIVNTLVLSVVERTRELGLLRAVGATRRQVRTVVRRESVLMSMLGAVTGLALGTGAGVALSRALADEGISRVTVPVTTLLVYLVVAAGVGVLAAIGPARRASRVDVLQAITTE